MHQLREVFDLLISMLWVHDMGPCAYLGRRTDGASVLIDHTPEQLTLTLGKTISKAAVCQTLSLSVHGNVRLKLPHAGHMSHATCTVAAAPDLITEAV